VSQIETDNPEALVERRAEINAALEQNRAARDHLFSALLVTDVTALDSLLFVTGKKCLQAISIFPSAPGDLCVEGSGIPKKNLGLILK
jgi:inorganic pyrophosphatase/exopolyphosphatase